jgi:hypothetical protein
MIVFVLASILLGVAAPQIEQGRWAKYMMLVCLLSLRVGYVLFGIDTLKYRLLPRWNVLPLLVGSTVVFSIVPDLFGVPNYHPAQLGAYFLHFAITGVCWALLGIAMMDQRQAPQPTPAI